MKKCILLLPAFREISADSLAVVSVFILMYWAFFLKDGIFLQQKEEYG